MEENEEGSSSDKIKSPLVEIGNNMLEVQELKVADERGSVADPFRKFDDSLSVVDDDLEVVKDDEGLGNLATEGKDYGVGGEEVGNLGKGDVAGEVSEMGSVGGGGKVGVEVSAVEDGGAAVEEDKEMEVLDDVKAEVVCEAEEKVEVVCAKDDDMVVEEKVEMEEARGNDGGTETVNQVMVNLAEEVNMEEGRGNDGGTGTVSEVMDSVAERVMVDEVKENDGMVETISEVMVNMAEDVTEKGEREKDGGMEAVSEVMDVVVQKVIVEEERLAMGKDLETKGNGNESVTDFDNGKEKVETEKEAEEKANIVCSKDEDVKVEMEQGMGNDDGMETIAEVMDVAEVGVTVEEETLAMPADLETKVDRIVLVTEFENEQEEMQTERGEAEEAKVEGSTSVSQMNDMQLAEQLRSGECLGHGGNLLNTGEGMALEEETMKTGTEKSIDGTGFVLKLDDEEEMKTGKDSEVTRIERGELVPESDDLQLDEDGYEVEDEEAMVGEDEFPAADTEMETETDAVESVKLSGGKRKRGKNSKILTKAPARKTKMPVEGEDVCFICFDGGDLVLCDRKNCPKAYHPSCVNRDEKFFQAKGRWNCGWHQCSNTNCQKNAYYMCYTCMFSLCKGCIKDAVILCVRGNKGFCEVCMKTVMLIEDSEQGNKVQVDFDDKSSWEYLFKDYWIDLKKKLSISSDEIAQAKNPWKGSDVLARKNESPEEQLAVKDDGGSGSDNTSDNPEASKPKRRKTKKRLKSQAKQDELKSEAVAFGAERTSAPKTTDWASKELLEFVMHMKDGDRSFLSQFDVQALLLEYIKSNKLRDPRRKSQIICDARLESIFGKARVGHFEMLKLLESHFLVRDDAVIDDVQGSVVDTDVNHVNADGNTESLTKVGKNKKRKSRKRDNRGRQSNIDDYAAIDMHNISLIYLRRKLMEDLLEDIETFYDKVIGTFVRIRISGSNQKQDIYRLVQVVGTSKADEVYKVGKRTTDIMLEILNLNKTEIISIDSISNQEFTEDECKRLRQSIKCGLINRMTVGDILDKAMEVQVARVNDWLESELMRLSHLRDRASDLGKKKQLRECVESLQLLKTPEERRRRLEDIPEIHADPNMDPNYESEDNNSEVEEMHIRSRGSGFSRRGREPISPARGDLKDSWRGTGKNSGKSFELDRNFSSNNLGSRIEDAALNTELSADNSWNQGSGKDIEIKNNSERPSSASSSEAHVLNRHSAVRSEPASHVASGNLTSSLSIPVDTTAVVINEKDKLWHYQDPSGKVQGPFSMVQLRKWNNSGYFPADLKIWRNTENKENYILLTDALVGKFHMESPCQDNGNVNVNSLQNSPHLLSPHNRKPSEISLQQGKEGQDGGKLKYDHNHDALDSRVYAVSIPSPTPKQNTRAEEAGPHQSAVSHFGGHEALQLPAATPDGFRSSAMVSERTPQSSHSGISDGLNLERRIIDSNNSLQTSQLSGAVETHVLLSQNLRINAPETPTNVVQSGTSQNTALSSHSWGIAPSQIMDENSSISMSGQQPAQGTWGGVPSTPVQNPAVSVPTQSVSPNPLPDPWRPPIPNNQSNMQPPAQPNAPWSMGIVDNSASSQNLQPGNMNSGWGTVPVNPSMGWGGQVPNINWVNPVQGPPPVNANQGWAVPTGNQFAAFQGPVPGNFNPGWVAPPSNSGAFPQVFGPPSANQGWVTPAGNMGPTAQGPIQGSGNPVWAPPNGNVGPNVQGPTSGNANQGWGSPAGNQGNQRNENYQKGERFSGKRDRGPQHGRSWNKHSSGVSRNNSSRGECYMFQESGHCSRGASCKFRHSQP